MCVFCCVFVSARACQCVSVHASVHASVHVCVLLQTDRRCSAVSVICVYITLMRPECYFTYVRDGRTHRIFLRPEHPFSVVVSSHPAAHHDMKTQGCSDFSGKNACVYPGFYNTLRGGLGDLYLARASTQRLRRRRCIASSNLSYGLNSKGSSDAFVCVRAQRTPSVLP